MPERRVGIKRFVLYCRYEVKMSVLDPSPTLSRRFVLVFIGLALVCISLAVLLYVFWPTESVQLQATLQPTVVVSP